MKDYSKPCIKEEKLDHLMLHVGTNDLASEHKAERISWTVKQQSKFLFKKDVLKREYALYW